MVDSAASQPALDERFQEPEGWRWHSFVRENRKIRFGSVSPKDSVPDAVVVFLPGLADFTEKYYELARDLNKKNMAVWIIDWMGQGGSGRYLNNPQKCHGADFQKNIDDLHYFIMEYIKHASVHPDVGRIPMAMLGYSMGGNIGLRYLHQHPETFECAALAAPMLGIKPLSKFPKAIARLFTHACYLAAGKRYTLGGGDWSKDTRDNPVYDFFTSDEARSAVHNTWCEHNTDLQVGSVTYGWLHHARRSCVQIGRKAILRAIETPLVIASAGTEVFVDNKAIERAISFLPNAEHIHYDESKHEILMEKDSIRGDFLDKFYALVQKNIIDKPETLKPF